MKKYLRLCALFCTLTLLLGALAGCVSSLPNDKLPALSESETAGEGGTQPETAPETTPETAPESGGDVESLPETAGDTETAPETEPAEDVSLPEGHTYLFEGEALLGIANNNLSGSVETDEAGTSYMMYRPKNSDPHIYFANATGDIRLSGVRYLRIKYRSDKVTGAELYIGNEKQSDDGKVELALTADGEWHVLTLDLMAARTYAKTLSIFRLDPMENRKSGSLQVAWMALYPDNGAPDPKPDPLDGMPLFPSIEYDTTGYEGLDNGFYYKASGALSGEKGTYSFKEGFALDILHDYQYFNRYTIGYDSTSPLRGEITYSIMHENGDEESHTEEFFLEAGEGMTFSSLIDGFFDEAFGSRIQHIELKSADGSTAEFTIRSVKTNVVPVMTAGTYYMENDRYIVGILLEWGGTISYIEDKKDNDPEIANLINRFDPGRLVQQSYYGVGDGPHYTAGIYNGNVWNYNPVQGGNLTGVPSKLVDFSISEDGKTVYIKCRPQDWAQKSSLTPSYMENTYTLLDTGVHVSNRFVDFFGVKHGKRHAELPAFYTISHLGVFHYYNGSKPWTGDAYTSLPNEPDWAGNNACYHNVAKGNTETWAAWTNTAGYGIGLYVPGTEILLAGRHAYNGSKDPYNGATNYVAPLRTMEFFSFVPFEYEYVISTGTVEEMRETFKPYAQ